MPSRELVAGDRPVPDGGLRRVLVHQGPRYRRDLSWLGKLKAARGVTGYPVVELMTLAETGTRALPGAVFGPSATGETDYACQLLHLLTPDMLVLADRGFDAAAFLGEVAAAGAAVLVRLTARSRPPVLARLDDGSFLSRIGELTVRIIDAVGFQNSATGLDLGFYAARSYSLMRPPRTGRRLIRPWERSATGWSGRGGWSWRLRWGRRPL